MDVHRFVSWIEKNMAALDLIRFTDGRKREGDKIIGDCPLFLLMELRNGFVTQLQE